MRQRQGDGYSAGADIKERGGEDMNGKYARAGAFERMISRWKMRRAKARLLKAAGVNEKRKSALWNGNSYRAQEKISTL